MFQALFRCYFLDVWYQHIKEINIFKSLTDHSQSLGDFDLEFGPSLACSNKIMRYAAARLCASVAFLSHPLWLSASRIPKWKWFGLNPRVKMNMKMGIWAAVQQAEKDVQRGYVTRRRSRLSVFSWSCTEVKGAPGQICSLISTQQIECKDPIPRELERLHVDHNQNSL